MLTEYFKNLLTKLKSMENKISRSPLPSDVLPTEVVKEEFDEVLIDEEMGFSAAIREVIDGKKVTKVEWGNKNIYGLMKDGYLMLHKEDDKFYNWVVSEGDTNGGDWIVI
jgi:hypothetical protein